MAKVTVLGLGTMGSTLAQAFLGAGHEVTVWNRAEDLVLERVNKLVSAGARLAETAVDAVAASPLGVICVLDYPATLVTLQEPGVAGALNGRSLVCLCSGDPQGARDVAAWTAMQGGSYLDGGIIGYPRHIGQTSTVFIYSGNRAVFDAHVDTLRSLAGDARYLDADPGAAKTLYLAIWPYYYSALTGFFESAALAQSVGMPIEEFETLAPSITGLALEHIQEAAGRIARHDYAGDQASVDVHWEGFQPIVEAFHAAGLVARMTDAFVAHLEAVRAAGDGQKDIAGVYMAIARDGERA